MSDRDAVASRLRELIAEVSQLGLSVDDIDDEPNFVTRLGLQSTQILEITVEIENEFGVEFEETEITEELWSSIPNLVGGILAKKGGKA